MNSLFKHDFDCLNALRSGGQSRTDLPVKGGRVSRNISPIPSAAYDNTDKIPLEQFRTSADPVGDNVFRGF